MWVKIIYRTPNSHKCMGSLAAARSLYKAVFVLHISHENPYQYLSHSIIRMRYYKLHMLCLDSEDAMKSKVCMIIIFHMSTSCECMGFIGEALQLHAVYKKLYFLMWESVSGSISHVRCAWMCDEIEGSYDKIIITIVPSYTAKNLFVGVGIVTRALHS